MWLRGAPGRCRAAEGLLPPAAAGVVGMCKEHLGVALALKVPVFFLVRAALQPREAGLRSRPSARAAWGARTDSGGRRTGGR